MRREEGRKERRGTVSQAIDETEGCCLAVLVLNGRVGKVDGEGIGNCTLHLHNKLMLARMNLCGDLRLIREQKGKR
jgi:hypothetical protein